MTFSGIHVNFSFSEPLLRRSFRLYGGGSFQDYKNKLYLELAGSLAVYGWILTAVTAASPLLDSSFVEKGVCGDDVFMGLASVRCSELGYWNDFTPVLDYQSIEAYADSIEQYARQGLLKAPSELYYPIRLKPVGENNIKNFKNAAHYDLKTVKIVLPHGRICSVAQAAINIIDEMKNFFKKIRVDVQEILDFQYRKFEDANNRYAWKIRKQFQGGFVKKGMELAIQRQEECVD